ncbi:hypothetical protein EWM64_g2113 [Hericium alpestre]|uniref:Protein kinase domain-containing protein n=1 Tax=Hericium alpestre TaxID=135208 RepID=A0A4Z0A6D4_9AGAM|nr:hypothetical protein EWM64_g2113 [Hericium alpestre]
MPAEPHTEGRPPSVHDASKNGRGRSLARNEPEDSPSSAESERPSPSSLGVPRGRSLVRRLSNPFSEENLKKKGYHALKSFDKTFYVEKRWKLIRELGSGAYGVVISAADDISGEPVAIKMVTRVFEKTQLAKRALRELTLLRHFNNHENITGLIDVDAIAIDFNDVYLFLEPMEADLHQIIKSGQSLTNEHIQYFTYQILRVHRDLKPGNLLVNSDCELKICDFGLSRGFDSRPDENASQMTEYVATRWYRAPEIMLAFKRYNTAIDVWSIGCILAELMLGKPLFKGKDYVDQLNKILDMLGTPEESVIKRIGTERAQAYVRSLPFKKKVPFKKILPNADAQALDLLEKLLAFDPAERITVPQALQHPWLSAYHDVNDEPECPHIFDRWREIEKLETIEQYRDALWREIEDYRREVRAVILEEEGEAVLPARRSPSVISETTTPKISPAQKAEAQPEDTLPIASPASIALDKSLSPSKERRDSDSVRLRERDPLLSYARRASMFGMHSARNSLYGLPDTVPGSEESSLTRVMSHPEAESVAFPGMREGFVMPARSRTASTIGSEMPRKLLRTLSTVSIYETVEGEEAGRTGMPIARYIREKETGADAPASEMPGDFKGEDAEAWEEGLSKKVGGLDV